MRRIFTYTVTTEQNNMNILDFLKNLGYSHQVITHLKKTKEGITKNREWARVRDILHTGDSLTITISETECSEKIVPVSLPFPVVYEDEDLMIINKPAGMPIHPSQGNFYNTLANAAAYYFQQKQEHFIYRCINRLDRDTTGLLILAKHMYSASLLSNMISQREIHRTYLAIVHGITNECGMIEAPIGRVDGSTIERCIDPVNGEYACTHYKRICCKNGYSLVALTLDTGRTHQIRVHMKHIGHPLPGDFLYNPDYTIIKRQALHSHCLEFRHPITGNNLVFTADLPDDMRGIF